MIHRLIAIAFSVPLKHTSNVTAIDVTYNDTIKSIRFIQASYNLELQQGTSQSLSEYISTSDNVPVSATLKATDSYAKVPGWLTVNNLLVNSLSYTTGSEIVFVVNAANLALGTYAATVNASAPGYTNGKITINVKVVASTVSGTTLKVNFQDSATSAPSGWLRDYGQAFGSRSSAQQGTGNKYGWFRTSDNTPLELSRNGRKRSSPSDVLLATLMHMQGNTLANFTGTKIEGYWEAQITNGAYDVTVSVGDDTQIDSNCLFSSSKTYQ